MNVTTASCTICQRTPCSCHQNTAPAGQTTEEGVFQPFFSPGQAGANGGSCPLHADAQRKLTRDQSRSQTKDRGRKSHHVDQQVADRVGRKEKKDRVRETGGKKQQVQDTGRREGLKDSNIERSGAKEGGESRDERKDRTRKTREPERSSRRGSEENVSRGEKKDHARNKRNSKDEHGRDRERAGKDRQTRMDKRPEHESGDHSNLKTPADPAHKLGSVPQQRNNEPERNSRRSSTEKIRRDERRDRTRNKRDDKDQQGRDKERAEGRKDLQTRMDKNPEHESEDYGNLKMPADSAHGLETKVDSGRTSVPQQRSNEAERSSRRSSDEEIRRGERRKKKKNSRESSRNRRERRSLEPEPSSCRGDNKRQTSKASSAQLASSKPSMTNQPSSSNGNAASGVSTPRRPIGPPIVHSGILCDGSKCPNPGREIVGLRYNCRVCVPSFDLCECCYKSETHYPTHEFSKFDKPIVTHSGIICSASNCPNTGHEVMGPRYKCRSCVPSLDLCEYCYRSQRGTHNPSHAFWKFEQPVVTHHGITCDGSGCPSTGHEIMGPRYKCHSCVLPSFDLCEHCYKSQKGKHDRTHAFWKLETPPVTHSGVRCVGPNCLRAGRDIMGPRYNCQVCTPSYDLCESCHGSATAHDSSHHFRKFEKPITPQEQQLLVANQQMQQQQQQAVEELRVTSAQTQHQNQQSLQNMQAKNAQMQAMTYSRPQKQHQSNSLAQEFMQAAAEEAGSGFGEAVGGAFGEAFGEDLGEGLGESIGEGLGGGLGGALGGALAGSLFRLKKR